ncbi:hypothetical protein [Chryseobacterium luquanense]|uniref:Uncharacterized protein n=1 Tax=Chryseobacterium luquanense TaxID=2983766 RepID=A0ABT3Y4I0_9FLAO|nr:hypothetical protein [Chryseobacterium luquanense]MCX8533062.1 hypothetical protein [Chryseobacterium luquanense]
MPRINKALILEITPEQFLNQCSPLELKEIDTLIQGANYVKRMESQTCSVCGCTDYDCRQCIEKTGRPCHWYEDNLCSACAGSMAKIQTIEHDA